jgi:ketosteroid isomerase-like protein
VVRLLTPASLGGGARAPPSFSRLPMSLWNREENQMSLQQDNLAVVVAWLDAMRRGDLRAVEALFASDVVWRGVPADAICHDRGEVLEMLEGRIEAGFDSIEALELVTGEDTVVLGICSPELNEVGEQPLPGQLFNAFTLRDGRVIAAQDYAERGAALEAAGVRPPQWV